MRRVSSPDACTSCASGVSGMLFSRTEAVMIAESFAGLSTVGQVSVGVKSVDRAVEFYRDRLGLPLLFQAPPSLAFFDAGGLRLMLSPPEPGTPERGSSVLYFKVGHIDVAHQALLARGVQFTHAPHVIA